jgi:hypothetical protein
VAENGAIDLVSLHYNVLLAMGAIKNERWVCVFFRVVLLILYIHYLKHEQWFFDYILSCLIIMSEIIDPFFENSL